MIRVTKSDTGQFVLIHDPSQTVVVDDRLEAAFERMLSQVKANHPEMAADLTRPFEAHKAEQRAGARVLGGFAWLLVLLPFVWLGVLHQSMGSLVDEYLAAQRRDAPPALERLETMAKSIDDLRVELAETGRAVAAIKQSAAPDGGDVAAARRQLDEMRLSLDGIQNEIRALGAVDQSASQDRLGIRGEIRELRERLGRAEASLGALAGGGAAGEAPPADPGGVPVP